MAHLALLVLCVALAFPGQCLAQGEEAAAAAPKQPPEGQCCYFKWGGKSGLHYYICCNNCDENNGQPVCDGTTYDGASDGDYCGHCGVDKGNAKKKISTFDCGGCDGQTKVKKACDKKHKNLIPGFCWKYSDCFEKGCKNLLKAIGNNSTIDDMDYEPFCGDGRCGSEEDHNSCPYDCCSTYNQDDCRPHCDLCPPECCGEPGCCKN
ncbi:uncharacterized protein [Branchiostoma lanceolatum]|uniref:uncharacterized protein n=1 Tax=Branchiostoma lanceolatum TaxID=7740 RepID=UPI003455043F